MQLLHLPSPAKINLFLHIVGRRADGYHLLQTAFQFVDFCDYISFKLTEDPGIFVHAPQLSLEKEKNLIYRAATALLPYKRCTMGIHIYLDKRIPLGAGLGGGSSNAATTLMALNKLWKIGFSSHELIELGSQLGADVPIFLYGKAAFAQGIGERLQAITPPEEWVLLLFPSCQVSTAKIFSDIQLTRNTARITITEFFEKGGQNDCEPIARKNFPQIAHAFEWLEQYTKAKLTGTGSCIFAIFKEKQAALDVALKMPASLSALVAKGLNNSPLHNLSLS